MAKAATRKGDWGSGHGSWPPRQSIQGSPDVFINGIAAHRQGDEWATHCNPQHLCHKGYLASGSPIVYTNGKQQGRVGDPVNCGSFVTTGSPNVFIGDSTPPATSSMATSQNISTEETTPDGTPISQDGSEGGTVPYYASPGGGGGKATLTNDRGGGPYTASDSQHATGLNYKAGTVNKNVSTKLGGLSSRYESNGNPAAIFHDINGTNSYGSYQINVGTGTMDNFLKYEQTNNPSAYATLSSAAANGENSEEFQTAWKNLAENDDSFADDQKSFIQSTHYDVAVDKISKLTNGELDINSRSLAVQDAVWSTAVQNGPNSAVFTNAFSGKDISSMSDSDIINAIYDERGKYNSDGSLAYFTKASAAVQNSVANRFINERAQALGML